MAKPATATYAADELRRMSAAREPLLKLLPEARDMSVRAYLRDAAGSLVASGEAREIRIGRGPNDVAIAAVARTAEPAIVRGSDGVDLSDGTVIKGVAVDLTTGIPDAMPGVARVDVMIGGEAYAGEPAVIATFDAPRFFTYTWRPANASKTYLPRLLEAGQEKRPFALTALAVDPFGQTVGTTRLDLSIVGTAFVEVGINP